MVEREAKLLVPDDFEFPAPEELPKRLTLGPTETIEQRAVYYDTRDLRLVRSGASLRYRSDDGWTVKLPSRRRGKHVLVRAEHTYPGSPGSPPQPALDLVRAFTRTQPVVEIGRIRTERRRCHLFDGERRELAEIADDDVTATTSNRSQHFREIEIELADDAPGRLLDRLVRRFQRAGAEAGDAIPKIARALGSAALQPPDVVIPGPPEQEDDVSTLVKSAIVGSVDRLLTHDPAVRSSEDGEAIHQMRVATRRLRSDLRTFRPVLVPGWSEPLREELRWLGRLLGRVRDADVLNGLLVAEIECLPPDRQGAGKRLLRRLEDAEARDRTELRTAMSSERYSVLLERLVDASREPRLQKRAARQHARRAARRLLRKPRRRVQRAYRALSDPPRDQELHALRKRAKQYRYALEAVAPVARKHTTRSAKRFAELQDVLGAHQDDVVARDWLVKAGHDDCTPDVTFVAGELAGRIAVHQATLRDDWPRAWKRAQSP